MAKIGIGDVAKAAGVSEATVSRVINNRGVVAPDTRRVVEEAMRSVGYSRASPGNLVLLITPGLTDPFFARLADRLSAALGRQGYRPVVASAPVGGTQELDYVAAMADAGMVATVFVSANNTLVDADPAVYRLLEQRRIPFICIDGPVAGVSAPTLSTDDLLAAELAVDHLWGLGHRRLGIIAGPIGNRPSDLRVQGFLAAVEARGGSGDDAVVVRNEYSVEGGNSAAGKLIGAEVTGIVAASDEMAFGAIRARRRGGLRVPRDISVVGYDDAFPLEFLDPPLTTVRQPIERLAQAVVPVLTRLVQGRPVDTGELLFDPELIVRGSTAPRP
ncbi:LacI family DNA-binding transcriptional regulator [Streptomyces sp. SBT349]|uniref:LacI family DNA-binding transcriptional regulator n=1 Tax=Streptomyces sp. SBT349 TaxID=1580539 RepID=UPI00066CCCBF|nr:LacI family DNA-binding transcriptional regulator [Streptomyces sp. SBT349]